MAQHLMSCILIILCIIPYCASHEEEESSCQSSDKIEIGIPKLRPFRPLPPSDRIHKTEDEWKQEMSELSYMVTRLGHTESPFENEYWNNHRKGTYVSVCGGRPLFRSEHKFDSGSGWPSFYQPIHPGAVVTVKDNSYGMERIEVLDRASNCHLGHLFEDGPPPTGKRYCINSAALKFIPDEEDEKS